MPDDVAERAPVKVPARERKRTRLATLFLRCAYAYAFVVVLCWIGLRFLGDRFWLATLLTFGPRWVLAAPLVILVPLALVLKERAALAILVVSAAWLLFAVLDLRLSVSRLLPAQTSQEDVTLVTWNSGGRLDAPARLAAYLRLIAADVAVVQECATLEDDLEKAFDGWHVHSYQQMCLVSRFAIRHVEQRNREDVWKQGGSGAIVRYTIDGPAGPFQLLNLHLETVREGLAALMRKRFWLGIGELEANIAQRRHESALARGWADATPAPLVVAGDLNMPTESAIYRDYWSHLDNAFSQAGLGFGHTKKHWLFDARVDHVLVGPGVSARRAFVGETLGSDHAALVVVVRLGG
jgi:endonuclease/exonuclease/phosphatase (EEP) superfamily protein YafD